LSDDNLAKQVQAIEAWIKTNPLRRFRHEHRMTEYEVAVTLGVSSNSIRNWERGASRPKASYMARVAGLLGMRHGDAEHEWSAWYLKRPLLPGSRIYGPDLGKTLR
jgi:transcriptional regulator with XRE-family HTH domain